MYLEYTMPLFHGIYHWSWQQFFLATINVRNKQIFVVECLQKWLYWNESIVTLQAFIVLNVPYLWLKDRNILVMLISDILSTENGAGQYPGRERGAGSIKDQPWPPNLTMVTCVLIKRKWNHYIAQCCHSHIRELNLDVFTHVTNLDVLHIKRGHQFVCFLT